MKNYTLIAHKSASSSYNDGYYHEGDFTIHHSTDLLSICARAAEYEDYDCVYGENDYEIVILENGIDVSYDADVTSLIAAELTKVKERKQMERAVAEKAKLELQAAQEHLAKVVKDKAELAQYFALKQKYEGVQPNGN